MADIENKTMQALLDFTERLERGESIGVTRVTRYDTPDGPMHVRGSSVMIGDWTDCLDRIDKLRELKQNWDSYGANPVDPGSIEVAKQLVHMLAQITGTNCPRVAASPAGNVALSWEDQSRELNLEIQRDGNLRYSFLDERQPSQDTEGETVK